MSESFVTDPSTLLLAGYNDGGDDNGNAGTQLGAPTSAEVGNNPLLAAGVAGFFDAAKVVAPAYFDLQIAKIGAGTLNTKTAQVTALALLAGVIVFGVWLLTRRR